MNLDCVVLAVDDSMVVIEDDFDFLTDTRDKENVRRQSEVSVTIGRIVFVVRSVCAK
jgi:hypothetical protein